MVKCQKICRDFRLSVILMPKLMDQLSFSGKKARQNILISYMTLKLVNHTILMKKPNFLTLQLLHTWVWSNFQLSFHLKPLRCLAISFLNSYMEFQNMRVQMPLLSQSRYKAFQMRSRDLLYSIVKANRLKHTRRL